MPARDGAREDAREAEEAPAPPAADRPVAPVTRAGRKAPAPAAPADVAPPAVAAPAEPAPPADPAPVATGTVVVRHCPTRLCAVPRTQDRSVLRADGKELPVGVVPVGRYELWTTIGNAPPKRTQTLVVEAGRTIRVLCFSLEARCVIE